MALFDDSMSCLPWRLRSSSAEGDCFLQFILTKVLIVVAWGTGVNGFEDR